MQPVRTFERLLPLAVTLGVLMECLVSLVHRRKQRKRTERERRLSELLARGWITLPKNGIQGGKERAGGSSPGQPPA
jgi:hypothetical protein